MHESTPESNKNVRRQTPLESGSSIKDDQSLCDLVFELSVLLLLRSHPESTSNRCRRCAVAAFASNNIFSSSSTPPPKASCAYQPTFSSPEPTRIASPPPRSSCAGDALDPPLWSRFSQTLCLTPPPPHPLPSLP